MIRSILCCRPVRQFHSNFLSLNSASPALNAGIAIDAWLKRGTAKSNIKNRKKYDHHHNGENRRRKKPMAVRWSSGTERAKEAANHMLSKVFETNSKGNIRFFNQISGKVEDSNIREFAKGIDLSQHGINIVNIINTETEQLPFVKLVDTKTALKKYSDYLAEKKEEELKSMGLLPRKFFENSKTNEDNLKHIKISWSIKEDDLAKQKAHDITSMLKKGNKVNLYIADKEDLGGSKWMENFENVEEEKPPSKKRLRPSEIERRESIIEQLKLLVSEISADPIIEGRTNGKMIIRLTPKVNKDGSIDKRSLKELKKQQRIEKLNKKLQRKKERELQDD
ncbi:hypothetical protein B1J92_L05698g [Nakaseomyces glabratus]|nr:hypothetical protein B1J91_L05698g [Nakaseomyces glabratus]OXB46257.1 hypothetical protein B1J92_L05698g [Nakaseomyces glabratus]